MIHNVYASSCNSGDVPDSNGRPCVCGSTGQEGCRYLCRLPSDPDFDENVDWDCSTTEDDYFLRYAIYLEKVHPLTGKNCSKPGNGPCPQQACRDSFTLHNYYTDIFGFKNATHNIGNFNAAEKVCAFNVGYFGDCNGGHEPCAYNEWNGIEYTTSPEFCYTPEGMSGFCRNMHANFTALMAQRGDSYEERYEEEVLEINVKENHIEIITFNTPEDKRNKYMVKKGSGELVIGITPNQLKRIKGNLVDWMKTVRAPIITQDGIQRGGGLFMDQTKGASPLSVNPVFDEPYFAFLFEQITKSHYHMSARHVGYTGYHSRMEHNNDWVARLLGYERGVYSDYWQQGPWKSAFECISKGECTIDVLKDLLIQNYKLLYPDNLLVQSMNRSSIIDVLYAFIEDGWHWQTPGNHNTPQQFIDFVTDMFVVGNKPEWAGFLVAWTNSALDLTRDGWVSGGFRQNSRWIKRFPRYDLGSIEETYWDEILHCGLQELDEESGEMVVNTNFALSNEFPHMNHSSIPGTPPSPTGYYFPYKLVDGEVSLVDATIGKYHGVLRDNCTPNCTMVNGCTPNCTLTLCKFDDAAQRCLPHAF